MSCAVSLPASASKAALLSRPLLCKSCTFSNFFVMEVKTQVSVFIHFGLGPNAVDSGPGGTKGRDVAGVTGFGCAVETAGTMDIAGVA